MLEKGEERQLEFDFTDAPEPGPQRSGSRRPKSRRIVRTAVPEDLPSRAGERDDETTSKNLAAGDSSEILRKIEEHVAAIRNQRQRTAKVWLTINDVADELGVSRDTVERLIAAGKIRAAPMTTTAGKGVRKMYRIKAEWFEEFIESLASKRPADHTARPRRGRRTEGVDFIE